MEKNSLTVEKLFELGAHFGHRKRFWNPNMEEFIFCEKNNIHIINLFKTQEKLLEFYDIFKNLSAVGNKIMIVGTKRAANTYVESFGMETEMPYISHRWLGGMLTNWETVSQSIKRLKELESKIESGEINNLTKKEKLNIERSKE